MPTTTDRKDPREPREDEPLSDRYGEHDENVGGTYGGLRGSSPPVPAGNDRAQPAEEREGDHDEDDVNDPVPGKS
jgi:hypothetical protein